METSSLTAAWQLNKVSNHLSLCLQRKWDRQKAVIARLKSTLTSSEKKLRLLWIRNPQPREGLPQMMKGLKGKMVTLSFLPITNRRTLTRVDKFPSILMPSLLQTWETIFQTSMKCSQLHRPTSLDLSEHIKESPATLLNLFWLRQTTLSFPMSN